MQIVCFVQKGDKTAQNLYQHLLTTTLNYTKYSFCIIQQVELKGVTPYKMYFLYNSYRQIHITPRN